LVLGESTHILDEKSKYQWAKERNGEFKRDSHGRRIPVDRDNHTIDAIRYVILYYYWEVASSSHTSDL